MYRIEVVEVTEREVGPSQAYQKISDADGGKYAYVPVPNRNEVQKVERKVLTQEVETVDVAAVIKAINNL
jgi:hypothetical protein